MDYPRSYAHGVMFHHFYGHTHVKGQGAISQDEFDRILNFVGVGRILSPKAWLEKLAQDRLKNDDVCLTFDDSLRCQFDLALPVLETYNIKAFWFVSSSVFEGHLGKTEIYRTFRSKYFNDVEDFYDLFFKKISDFDSPLRMQDVLDESEIEKFRASFPFYSINDIKFRLVRDRYLGKEHYEAVMDKMLRERVITHEDLAKDLWMTGDQLKYLCRTGHEIGLHSYSHPTTLCELPYAEQLQEYHKNYAHLSAVCQRSPLSMAHPCDSYNTDTIGILRSLGIRCGFRSNMFPKEKGGRVNPSEFEIARQDHANIMKMVEQ